MSARVKGLLCAVLGPVLWGVSGNVAQWLFDSAHLRPDWLVAVRLLLAGCLLMIWCLATRREETVALVHQPHLLIQALGFGVFGVVVSQFSYFTAVATSNAPTTTVLQYLGPLFIVLWLALRTRSWPARIDVISLIVAFVGIILLVTHGQLTKLALSPQGLFWGVAAGLGAALYTLLPVHLLQQVSAPVVIAWAMLFAGIVMSPVLWLTQAPHLTVAIVGGIGYVTVFGTLFAYLLYLVSLQAVSPTVVGMLNVFEPLTATVVAIIAFHAHFGIAEIVGGLLVLSTSFLQVLPHARRGVSASVDKQD
ncbi:DMT family transporter [Lacticaseibacillus jixiensis]|uniref:DMT family transporter n=1 Tax=Lacticaseibacillus jixiensis TaxID=3231926 RepID=UPI0036F21041